MNIENIIFDVDGTLWDSTGEVAKAWNLAVKELGIECEEITSDTLKREFGKPMNVIADHLFPSASAAEKERALELFCMYEHEVLERCEENLLYPGVKETIQELAKTHKVCVVSNCQSGYIELFLKKNQLEQYVLDTECYGDTKKSKGENIRLVIERNHLQNCVYVGDTEGDCEAAKAAGIPFIFAAYGFGNVETFDKEIRDVRELLEIL